MPDRVLYRANDLPVLQNRTFATYEEALASPRGDVLLVVDEQTGLVHNAAFDEAKLVYDEKYQNEQALSPSFKRHLEDVTRVIDRHLKGKSIVEIGCGKGHYLDLLRGHGYDAVGVDPSYAGPHPYVISAPYSRDLGLAGEGLVLRHVLEHIADPVEFLFDIQRGNGGKGLIYIEVPCFDWICARRTWFDVFYEHVNYFRLTDFDRMFGKVLESGRLFGGQYLYAVADLETLRRPVRDVADDATLPEDFASGRDSLAGLPQAPRAIWSGASKGVIFAMHLKSVGVNVDMAIDINPAKQDQYLPCSGLQVLSPEAAMAKLPDGSEVYVMNSNYLDEIRELSNNRFDYRVVDHAA